MQQKERQINWHLAKYREGGGRRTCPWCGKKKHWKPFVDECGTPFSAYFANAEPRIRALAEEVGACDSAACRVYSVKEFYRDTRTGEATHSADWVAPPPPPKFPDLPMDMVRATFQPLMNTFVRYLIDVAKFDADRLAQVLLDYRIGSTRDGDIIYWHITAHNEVRDGKVMRYKADGHRDKDTPPWWMNRKLAFTPYSRLSGKMLQWAREVKNYLWQQVPTTITDKEKRMDAYGRYDVIKPMFGEHLLADPRYKDKPVAIVEGEKSCLICAYTNPRWIWLAQGTRTFDVSKFEEIKRQGREVWFFRDMDQIEDPNGDLKNQQRTQDAFRENLKLLNYDKVKIADDAVKRLAKTPKDDVGDIMMRWALNGRQSDAVETTSHEDEAKMQPKPDAYHGEQPKMQPKPDAYEDKPKLRIAYCKGMEGEKKAAYVKQQMTEGLRVCNYLDIEPSEAMMVLAVKLDLVVDEQWERNNR